MSEIGTLFDPNVMQMSIDSSVKFTIATVENAWNLLNEALFSVISVVIELERLFAVLTLTQDHHLCVDIFDFFRW